MTLMIHCQAVQTRRPRKCPVKIRQDAHRKFIVSREKVGTINDIRICSSRWRERCVSVQKQSRKEKIVRGTSDIPANAECKTLGRTKSRRLVDMRKAESLAKKRCLLSTWWFIASRKHYITPRISSSISLPICVIEVAGSVSKRSKHLQIWMTSEYSTISSIFRKCFFPCL